MDREMELQEDFWDIEVQPNTAPTILGLYAFSGSILLVAPWLAGLYGNASSPYYLLPLIGFLGGLAQFSAAMWAFTSRQWTTSVITTMWASEHSAWAILNLLYLLQTLAQPSGAAPGFGIWYIALAWITWIGAVAAIKQNAISLLILVTGALGATLLGVDEMLGLQRLSVPGAYLLIVAGLLAWYAASALLLKSTFDKDILPVWPAKKPGGKKRARAKKGEPGVK